MANEIVKFTDNEIGVFLEERAERLAKFAVREYGQKEFLRSAVLAISESENLQRCLTTEAGRASLYGALKRAASVGLSVSPQEGKSCLVAYNTQAGLKASYQIMKGGMIDLAMETGKIDFITEDIVRENDAFNIEKNAEGDSYRYQPALRDRGPVIGFFAAVRLKSGTVNVKYMSVDEMDEFSDRYNSSKKLGDKSPWKHSPIGMGLKTVVKALLRHLHLGPSVDAAIIADDRDEFDEDRERINVTPPRGSSSADVKAEIQSRRDPKPEDDPEPDPVEDDGFPPEDAREKNDQDII